MEQHKQPFFLSMPPFQSIVEASRTTGLSQSYIRRGVRNGTIPHVQSGAKYLVNVVRLLEDLNALPGDRG